MDSAYCGLHNDKYTKYSSRENCVNRAFIESLEMLEEFRICERKVQIIAMIGS